MNTAQLQIEFLQAIKKKISPAISFVDELAQVLQIGTDSAYRRIRAEKPLSFDELYRLCTHYQVSFDDLFRQTEGSYLFQGGFVDAGSFQFNQYLQGILQQVRYINSFAQRHLYYLCKDVPIFHHFYFRELAAFKYYFWMKTIINHPSFAQKPFSFADYSDELFQLGQNILSHYNQMDSTEIWNIDSINSTLQQIDYYRATRVFENEADIVLLYEMLEKMLQHLEQQAELGYKFAVGDADRKPMGAFYLYHNEVILGDNSILGVMDTTRVAFLIHSVINILATRDVQFCSRMETSVQNLLKKSTQISRVSERERSFFFRRLRHRVEQHKLTLKVY